MKNYKEKYEHALDNFKKIKDANKDNNELVDFIEYEYPELKESEDDRIGKMIIHVINITPATIAVQYRKEMLDWLEKQVEKKVDKCEGCNNIKGCITCTDGDQYAHITEQKPTNEIKPKFKVGDTIRLKGSSAEYTIESIYGGCYHGKGWGLSIDCCEDYELVEQKPAWSEEDEKMFSGLNSIVEDWYNTMSEKEKEYYGDCGYIKWLKSLKERYTWKPSDEQMKQLGWVAEQNKDNMIGKELMSLYQDLKKLREE